MDFVLSGLSQEIGPVLFLIYTRDTLVAELHAAFGLTARRRKKETSTEKKTINIKYTIYKQTTTFS